MVSEMETVRLKLLEALGDLQQITIRCLDAILRDSLDREAVSEMLKAVGGSGHPLMPDPYKVLGLERSAPDEEVKRQYRELLHRLHPDTGGPETMGFLLGWVLSAYERIKKERGWT